MLNALLKDTHSPQPTTEILSMFPISMSFPSKSLFATN